MLTQREQFKAEFLLKAAQQGIPLGELHFRIKQALASKEAAWSDLVTAPYKKLVDVGGNLVQSAGTLGLGAAAMAPLAVGGLAGHTLAKTEGLGSSDLPEEEKQRELIDAYRRAAEKARLSRSVRDHQTHQRSRPSYSML